MNRLESAAVNHCLQNEHGPWLTESLPYRGDPHPAAAASEAAYQPWGVRLFR